MIIKSILDTDLYKFTMMQSVLHQFPGAKVEYHFKCRTPNINLVEIIDQIYEEAQKLSEIQITTDEADYLRSMRFIKSDFVDFLELFRFNPKYLEIKPSAKLSGEIEIIINGPWLHTILFEIPLLAIVNELWFNKIAQNCDFEEGKKRLTQKISLVNSLNSSSNFIFADYGTRRRFSHNWQKEVLQTLKEQSNESFVGTSNVFWAYQLGLIPVGTMAHEYLQAAQALGPRLIDSQKFAFQSWADEYRGDLGIALSDVCGMKAFFRDFDMYFCKLFDGARQDSGDPIDWGEKMINHYQNNRIDPKSKILVFSDNLTFEKAINIYNNFKDRTNTAFGIGTNLMNDVGYDPINIVIKMVRCNSQTVAKVTDEPGKNICLDEGYLKYLRKVFEIE